MKREDQDLKVSRNSLSLTAWSDIQVYPYCSASFPCVPHPNLHWAARGGHGRYRVFQWWNLGSWVWTATSYAEPAAGPQFSASLLS